MISKRKFAELRKIFNADLDCDWSGWKNIAISLWDAYRELDQEFNYLARYLSENDDCGRIPEYWRTRAERVMEHD